MSSALVWKARPIFISSTFRDMHAERDYLRAHGFLRLVEQLRERSHNLDTIDLRQGVETASETDEAKREMQVLKVCLDEIQRSKPFLVALLGERYGHIPPADRITDAARDAGLPASVEVADRSVTELEILFGVLENKEQQKRSWFYFRNLDRTGMPPEVSAKFPAEEPNEDPASPAGRLRALKDRIRRELPGRVREYALKWDPATRSLAGLKELDDRIAADLWSDLDAETSAYLRSAPKTWQEAEARMISDFAAERTRGYVDRPAVTDPMIAHALSPAPGGTRSVASESDWGLLVTGDSGSGKSSLFSRVFLALQPKDEAGDILLLAHAAGIYPQSGQVDRMLRRWITQLAAFLGVPDPLESDLQPGGTRSVASGDGSTPLVTSEDVDKAFSTLLWQASAKRRVVLLVDALNQFEPTVRAEYLTWLPKLWPDNARFIATAIPGKATAALKERPGCRESPVPPVGAEEAREIARRFYRERHHRGVDGLVVDELLAKQHAGRPAHGNPLWLALALQEMNLLEADDYERADRQFAALPGAQRMQALQLDEARKLPADVPGMYGELLDRAERGFGKAWADAFVDLIAVSRSGWRESDLRVLMPLVSGQPWDPLAFADVRRTLGVHIVQRGAQSQWDFFHATLRSSVLLRDMAEETTRRHIHERIASHLESLSNADPLRLSELMVHIMIVGDAQRALDYLHETRMSQVVRKDTLSLTAKELSVAAVLWTVLDASDEAARELLASGLAEMANPAKRGFSVLAIESLIQPLIEALARAEGSGLRRFRRHLLTLTQVKLRSAQEKHQGGDFAKYHELSLFAVQQSIGEMLREEGDYNGALKLYESAVRNLDHPAPNASVGMEKLRNICHCEGLIGIGQIRTDTSEFNDGLAVYRRAIDKLWIIASKDGQTSDRMFRDILCCQEGVGNILFSQGDLTGALAAYNENEILTAGSKRGSPVCRHRLAMNKLKIADVLLAMSNYRDAVTAYLDSIGILEQLSQSNPSDVLCKRDIAECKRGIALAMYGDGDYAAALVACAESLRTVDRLLAMDSSSVVLCRDVALCNWCMGDITNKVKRGDALEYWRRAHELLSGMKQRGVMRQIEGRFVAAIERIEASGFRDSISLLSVWGNVSKVCRSLPTLDDLRASAETMFQKCLWDAASSIFEKLLAAGDPIEEVGPKLVKCLLNIHEPPTPGEVKRAQEVITKLEATGRSDLVAPLRTLLAAKVPPEKKGFIGRLFGKHGKDSP